MKAARGFTLIELVVVMAIAAILFTIATLNFNQMAMKAAIEGQIKTVHADMMTVRLDALYSKRQRSVVFSNADFKIYSSTITSAAPVSTKAFKYSFRPLAKTVTFDTNGMSNGTQDTICVNPYNDLTVSIDAGVDSIVISQARINLGKRKDGGNCDTDDVQQK